MLVLISDGEENCKADPCPTAKKLARSGVDLQFNAIGLAVGSKARKQLQCIADAGDGSYYDASQADELSDVIRKITQRALRPFQLTGAPVQATTETESAPAIGAGQYLDRYDDREQKRYYRISRTPGSTVTASITSLVKGRGSVSSDFWRLELKTESGQRCGAASAGASNHNQIGVLSGAVSSLTAAAAAATPTADGCASEPLLLGLSRTTLGGNRGEVAVELRITEEPAVTNLASLPKGLTSYDLNARAVKASSARPVVGGSSFSNAAELTPGSWRDSLAVGETVLYRVRLETGQRLRVTLDAPAPKSAWRLYGAETVAPDLRLYATNGVEVRQKYTVVQGAKSAALTAATPEVRVRNRESISDPVRATSTAGDYYVAVSLQPVQADLTGRVMPVRLSVAIDGEPAGQPAYAIPSPTPSATPSDPSPPPGSTPSGPPQKTEDPVDGPPVAGLVLAGSALVGLGVAAGILITRRRSRRS